MPTYQYRCTRCRHEFELFQSIREEPVARCPECRGRSKRLIGTGAGLLFKGDGFYLTDYRSEGYKRRAKEESSGAGASSGASGSEVSGEPGKSATPAPSPSERRKGKREKKAD